MVLMAVWGTWDNYENGTRNETSWETYLWMGVSTGLNWIRIGYNGGFSWPRLSIFVFY